MEPSRQILWNIHNRVFLDVASIVAAICLVLGFIVRISAWLGGRKGLPAGNRRSRSVVVLRTILVQKGMLRNRLYLVMHRCVFYGTAFLFAGSLLIALKMHLGLNILRGNTYLAFGLVMDVAGVAVLVGTGLAAYKRYIVRPGRLESKAGDACLLALLALIVLSGFLVKGLRVVATSDPWAPWSPVGNAAAMILAKGIAPESAAGFHTLLWSGHVALAFALIALMPWTKLLHMLAVPLNYYLSVPWAERASLGASCAGSAALTGIVADCTRKQLVEADACIGCGRCKKLCTIHQGGMPGAPATMMKNLRGLIHHRRYSSPLLGAVIDQGSLWSCSVCRSCEDRCPMDGAHAARIVDIRRGCLNMGRIPDVVAARFAENENALALSRNRRPVTRDKSDVYIWPGCPAGQAGQSATLDALESLLKRAGIGATMLTPPACCGGPIRSLGNESLFQRDVAANLDYLRPLRGETIITHCPHCFNTLKNEYPSFGGNFNVLHHARFLAGMLAEGKLTTAGGHSLKAVFHDPCFLGRYNDEFSAPRKLIAAERELTLSEMKHSRMKSFCCGSGGGTVVGDVALLNGRERVRQAVKEGAQAIVTACPYCHENLSAAALEEYPDKLLAVMDVIELFDTGGVYETVSD